MQNENPNLNFYLDRPVSELVSPETYEIDDGAKERHRLYSLLLMSITRHYWNGNKRGRHGKYGMNPSGHGSFEFADYCGHNIASLAIDAFGDVMDFEFNHNKLFNSSAEHAEARMVKRIYNLTQIHDSWKTSLKHSKPKDDYSTFEDVTMYTTLESCSQCAGVMALARVKEIVYLQVDPGMYRIGNILRNLTRKIDGVENSDGSLLSPMPLSGSDIGVEYFDELNGAFGEFCESVKTTPFFTPDGPDPKSDRSPSMTSFLCTKFAFDIYDKAAEEFRGLKEDSLAHPEFKPKDRKGIEIADARNNKSVLDEVKHFFDYATRFGRRGTPHR